MSAHAGASAIARDFIGKRNNALAGIARGAAYGAAIGVAIALAVVTFALRGKGHPEEPE